MSSCCYNLLYCLSEVFSWVGWVCLVEGIGFGEFVVD